MDLETLDLFDEWSTSGHVTVPVEVPNVRDVPPPPSPEDFKKWFPNAFTPGVIKGRLLCFHNNGSNEGVYTQPDLVRNPSTQRREKVPNFLLKWAGLSSTRTTSCPPHNNVPVM